MLLAIFDEVTDKANDKDGSGNVETPDPLKRVEAGC
jgi:hypothetical protein